VTASGHPQCLKDPFRALNAPGGPFGASQTTLTSGIGCSVSVFGVNGGVLARRAGIVAVCVLSLVACVGLAWWQWQRFESSTGTWQNLGYVLQWPLFGLFPAFMFWRFRKLRAQHGAATTPAPLAESLPGPTPEPDIPAPIRQDDSDDPELAAYNRYLAQLNALDQQETTR